MPKLDTEPTKTEEASEAKEDSLASFLKDQMESLSDEPDPNEP
jgi:hypothetical protein